MSQLTPCCELTTSAAEKIPSGAPSSDLDVLVHSTSGEFAELSLFTMTDAFGYDVLHALAFCTDMLLISGTDST